MQKQFFRNSKYEIYEDGRCYSYLSNKFLTPHKNGEYLTYDLRIEGKRTRFKIHRMVAEAFILNEDPDRNIVNHKDGNKLNNNVENLEWVTASENTQHAFKTGLIPSSNRNGIFYTQDLDGEIWKDIKDFSNQRVSNLGRVMNKNTKRLLRPELKNKQYLSVHLYKNKKSVHKLIHKLVYSTFNNEDQDLPSNFVINHIDGNKENNKLENLEKITKTENNLHAEYIIKTHNCAKATGQYTLDDVLIKIYPSIAEAHRQTGINNIGRAIKQNSSAGGYKWHFIDNEFNK